MLQLGLFSAAPDERLHFSDEVQHLKRIHLRLCKVTMQRPKNVGQACVAHSAEEWSRFLKQWNSWIFMWKAKSYIMLFFPPEDLYQIFETSHYEIDVPRCVTHPQDFRHLSHMWCFCMIAAGIMEDFDQYDKMKSSLWVSVNGLQSDHQIIGQVIVSNCDLWAASWTSQLNQSIVHIIHFLNLLLYCIFKLSKHL